MTIDEMIDLAKSWTGHSGSREPNFDLDGDDTASRLSAAVVDKLGVALPCGYETPTAVDGRVSFDDDSRHGDLSPDDARGIAATLLRAADEADAQSTRVE